MIIVIVRIALILSNNPCSLPKSLFQAAQRISKSGCVRAEGVRFAKSHGIRGPKVTRILAKAVGDDSGSKVVHFSSMAYFLNKTQWLLNFLMFRIHFFYFLMVSFIIFWFNYPFNPEHSKKKYVFLFSFFICTSSLFSHFYFLFLHLRVLTGQTSLKGQVLWISRKLKRI